MNDEFDYPICPYCFSDPETPCDEGCPGEGSDALDNATVPLDRLPVHANCARVDPLQEAAAELTWAERRLDDRLQRLRAHLTPEEDERLSPSVDGRRRRLALVSAFRRSASTGRPSRHLALVATIPRTVDAPNRRTAPAPLHRPGGPPRLRLVGPPMLRPSEPRGARAARAAPSGERSCRWCHGRMDDGSDHDFCEPEEPTRKMERP